MEQLARVPLPLTRPVALPRQIGLGLLLAAAYIVTGRLGLSLAENQENATLVWAPTGLSLAALVLAGRSLWPAVAAGAIITNLSIGTPLAPGLAIGAGNTLEALCGAWLLARVAGFDPGLSRLKDVLSLLLFGALICTLVSATCGVGSLYLAGRVDADLLTVWLDWWLGDVGGAVVVAPVLMVWARGRPGFRDLAARVETWTIMALVVAVSLFAFVSVVPPQWRLFAALLNFPLLVWAGLRLGPRGAVTASALASVVAIVGAGRAGGPFTGEASLYLTLAYVGTMGTVAMLLAAAVAERELADAARLAEERERRKLEQQLRESQRLEELGALAGGVAHDFNNLLVPILVNAELLSEDREPDDVEASMLEDIAGAAHRASELCQQLLTYAGRTKTASERVSLDVLVHEMRPLLEASISKKIELTLELSPEAVVSGDPSQLRQLVMSLVRNATEAIGDRVGAIRVTATVEDFGHEALEEAEHEELSPGRHVVLTVSDDGHGMDAATAERLFAPFFTTKFPGRGLGLAAALGIIRGHGGAIDVLSTAGRGTSIRILLPCCDIAPALETAEPAPRAVPRGTVLVADDELVVRRVIRRLLETAGYRVLAASDGQEAVEQFAAHTDEIALVIVDTTMPRLDGQQALVQIRRLRPEVRAILMSGYTAERLRDLEPNTTFLKKPFNAHDLETQVARAMADLAPALGA